MVSSKTLKFKRRVDEKHWVGDGFPVRTMFSYLESAEDFSPFLLMDYAGPENFPPATQRRGVGKHPHRGFETVTIVYAGEVEHHDSRGGGGIIGAQDVQWMTAASGVVHEEMHSEEFSRKGGQFEVVQLWVNLPAEHKKAAPSYQAIKDADIPVIDLKDGLLRLIAGSYRNTKGAAKTFTVLNLWDLKLNQGFKDDFDLPAQHNLLVFPVSGSVVVNENVTVDTAELAVFSRKGNRFNIAAATPSRVLVLSGAPIDEPVVGYGPFVMNSKEEIKQAYADYHAGRMG